MDANAPCIKVKCGVENCSYNSQLMCHANGLEVNALHGRKAEISDETCCTTFKDRE